MWVQLTPVSGNKKVGPIPVSTTETASCPSECSLKDTDCYARFGPLGFHWKKVKEGGRGDNWAAFCRRVTKFAKGQLWRHNQAGDLPQTVDGLIDRTKTEELSKAAEKTRGWTYTHYNPLNEHNRDAIASLNSRNGLTVNLSADSPQEADTYAQLGIGPVVVTLPKDTPTLGNKTPNGLTIVICPAQTQESMFCDKCKLCQVKDRKSVIGFLAHGSSSKRLSAKLATS